MKHGFVVLALVLGFSGGLEVHAEGLSVAQYINLTVKRLIVVQGTIETHGRGLTEDEEDAIWQQAGITAKEYYAFASAHREEVEAYLSSHDEARTQIEKLSTAIRNFAAQTDTAPKQPRLPQPRR